MKYYKYLPDLDWHPVSNKLRWYVLEENKDILLFDNSKNMWQDTKKELILKNVPELLEMIRPLNLTIRYVAFFISTISDNVIHNDHSPVDYRINLPVLNCENTETKFFTSIDEPERKLQDNGVTYYIYDPNKCTHVESYYLNCPVVLRVNELHQVIHNPIKIPRISFTMAFYEDISYLLED